MQNDKWKKWFKKENILVVLLSGILLLVISIPTNKKNEKEEIKEEVKSKNYSENKMTENNSEENSLFQYADELEKELERILTKVDGVGKAKVMITFCESEEKITEKEIPKSQNETTENDARGGTRTIAIEEYGETVIYTKSGTDSSPYIKKTILPKIEGILVVAEGAGDGKVNKTIFDIIQALFDVELHKIKVVKMET